MEKEALILLGGIVFACIWVFVCTILEQHKRKYMYIIGIFIDVVLFACCRNINFLLVGIVGGILCGLFPYHRNPSAIHNMLCEFKRLELILVFVIFFVMVFMAAAIANPKVKIIL